MKKPSLLFRILTTLFISLLLIEPSLASGGGGLPWEGPLKQIADSITGPVAFYISLIGMVVAMSTLLWGGEIPQFASRLILLVLVIAVIVFATNVLSSVMGISSAII